MARRREDRYAAVGDVAAVLSGLTLPAVVSSAIATSRVRTSISPPSFGEALAGGHKSVAVIPFKNNGGQDDAYLAEELTDDLIDALSMTRGLRVISRGVIEQALGSAKDPRETVR